MTSAFGDLGAAARVTGLDGESRCPCGRAAYADCCRPLHAGAPAATAEDLMRSRYSAFAVGDADYLLRTWHPGTRPDELTLSPTVTWTGLDVVRVERGGPADEDGVVGVRRPVAGRGNEPLDAGSEPVPPPGRTVVLRRRRR